MTTKVLLDARKLGDGGIGVYIENLVDGLLALRSSGEIAVEVTLLISPEHRPACEGSDTPNSMKVAALARWAQQVQLIEEPAERYSLSEYLMMPQRQRTVLQSHDIFHSPHYTLPYFLGIPTVITVHDILHISQPETLYHRPVARQLIRSALNRANHVLTVSEASRESLAKQFPAIAPHITVVPNALHTSIYRRPPEETARVMLRHQVQDPYAMFVGSDRPHKGFRELVDSWLLLREDLADDGKATPLLIAVGERYSRSTRDYVSKLGLDPWVRFVGALTSEELASLYSGAKAVVVPSREEGFGLMTLEAMACGTPLVCTPAKSLVEVCGDCALYSSDFTPRALAHSVLQVLSNNERTDERTAAGLRRVRQFSRELSARRIFQVYQQVLGREDSTETVRLERVIEKRNFTVEKGLR